MADSIVSADGLFRVLPIDAKSVSEVSQVYPMRITPYFLSLIRESDDPLGRQVVPDAKELSDNNLDEDPLCEEAGSPVFGLIHRYPGHVLFMVENRCAVYCRHCFRKRTVGRPLTITPDTIAKGIEYIKNTPDIREVVLSGGDPLVMDDGSIFKILEKLRQINHVKVLRIHTRVPGVLPDRITPELARGLSQFHPLYMNIQFNHFSEITPESEHACRVLADCGIPLGSQTVLLANINDDTETMRKLMRALLRIRVRPYYIHQLDRVRGAAHFHVPVKKGLQIMESLRGQVSGIGVPHYVVDLPGGGGKAPLPGNIVGEENKELLIRNFEGKVFRYGQ